MYLYNTLTRRKERFSPARPPVVRMYVCGPTTYNYIHLGNARPLVFFDTLRRYLEYRGYPVVLVQNFTDIDDKIINRAREEGKPPEAIARRYITEYFEDAYRLGVRPATIHPQVSQHIDLIIGMIEALVAHGFAYQVGGSVYFSVRRFAGYGKLSGRSPEEMLVGARLEVDPRKADPLDFALWKEAGTEEPGWESPWGRGRPGWHSECAAMALHYLGSEFDIHGGGADLIFPHHENEIAQAECFTGRPFARFWVHNGFITVREEKMSKSRGNFFLVRELLREFPGPLIRFYLLSTHYRSPLDFDPEKVEEARRAWERLVRLAETLTDLSAGPEVGRREEEPGLVELVRDYRARFRQALDDDCNTANAIAALFDFTHRANRWLQAPSAVSAAERERIREVLEETAGGVLGILPADGTTTASAGSHLVPELVDLVLEVRSRAREQRDWATADRLRQRLQELGIAVEDTPAGPRWRLEQGER
ncbi:MAG: cysteine--tRNA ligase [Moorellales bacterium]